MSTSGKLKARRSNYFSLIHRRTALHNLHTALRVHLALHLLGAARYGLGIARQEGCLYPADLSQRGLVVGGILHQGKN